MVWFYFRCRQGAEDMVVVEAGTVDVAAATGAHTAAAIRAALLKVAEEAAVEVAIPTIQTPATITAAVTGTPQLVTELTIRTRSHIDL